MAKATGLISLLLDATSSQVVPFAIPLYIKHILHGLTGVLLCVPFIFAHRKSVDFVVGTRWLPFIMEIVRDFHSGYFDCSSSFQTVVDLYCCITG